MNTFEISIKTIDMSVNIMIKVTQTCFTYVFNKTKHKTKEDIT